MLLCTTSSELQTAFFSYRITTYQFHFSVCNRLPSGVDILVDFSVQPVHGVMKSMSRDVGIAHVSSVDPGDPTSTASYNTSLNVIPPSSSMLQVRKIEYSATIVILAI